MRIHTLLLLLPIAFVPVAELQKPGTKPPEKPVEKPAEKPAETPPATVVPSQFLGPIEGIVKQLAKGGREKEAKDLITALENLGYPKANLEKLEKSTKEDLAKAKLAIDSLPSGAKQLRMTAKQLVAIMDKIEDVEAKKTFAQNILRLDGECVEAHKVLGHEKVGRNWIASDLKDLRVRRGIVLQKVEEAKKLEVPMETGEVDDPYIQKYCGVKATMVRGGPVEIHSNFNLERTTRILRETMRADAMASWITKGKLAVKPAGDAKALYHLIFIDSLDQYKKMQSDLASANEITEEGIKILEKPNSSLGGYNLKSGIHVVLAQWENDALSDTLMTLVSPRENIESPMSAGMMNWLDLSFFGCSVPNYSFKEELARSRGDTHVAAHDAEEREELVRMAKSGIAGSRTWMQYLAEHGEDPPWRNSFVLAIGAIQGNDLHKCTSVFEFLMEANLLDKMYSKYVGLKANSTASPVDRYNTALERASKDVAKAKAAEEAKKQPESTDDSAPAPEPPPLIASTVGEMETKWRAWLLGSRPGVAERIDKENLNAWPKDALSALAYMNEIRENSFKGTKIEGAWKLKFDPDLSEQCALHAHYLTLHPEQQQWPAAHEEYADKEGYTVEGAWAGLHSVIAWGGIADYKESIDGWMGTYYHRLPLISPGVLRLGWGNEDIYWVMDMSSLVTPYEKPYTVVYPYENQKEVPLNFNGNEYPDPVPNGEPGSVDESKIYGYPITIQTNPVNEHGDVIDITMKLYEGKGERKEVDCVYSSPSKPSNPEAPTPGAWCLLPKEPLKSGTEYEVVANWNTAGKGTETSIGKQMKWTFRTL